MTPDLLGSFLQKLHYQPHDSAIFQRAITHRSFSSDHNERLEFLGDAIIDLVIAESLYNRFSDKPEGELSRYRAELVRASTLAEIAREIELSQVIRLGDGERKSGGAERESILSGTVEALFGAIYLDSNLEQCKRVIVQLFSSRLDEIEGTAGNKDPKTALQELLQAKKRTLPRYHLVSVSGQHHHQVFRMACVVEVFNKTVEAEAGSKKLAERKAAELMLDWISKEKIL